MAKHNDHHDQNKHQDNLAPEASGIKARPVLLFLGVLAAGTAITFGIVWGLLIGLKKVDDATQPQRATELPEGQRRRLPPLPRLQGAPQGTDQQPSALPEKDWEIYRKQTEDQAKQYGWVNKEAGIASIPFERAKQLIIERGQPELSPELIKQVEQAEKMRKRVLNAQSNAGRIIEEQ